MRLTKQVLFTAAAFAIAPVAAPVAAQDSAPQPAPQERQVQASLSSTGELVRVDVDQKMFWIKSAADAEEMQFSFTDATEVTGEGKSVEGLSTMTGTRVKVEYKAENGEAVATKIEIQAEGAQAQPKAEPPAAAPAQPQD